MLKPQAANYSERPIPKRRSVIACPLPVCTNQRPHTRRPAANHSLDVTEASLFVHCSPLRCRTGIAVIMGFWEGIGLFVAGYLLLLARSAWKQGEIRQFLVSLAIVLVMLGTISGIVAATIILDQGW